MSDPFFMAAGQAPARGSAARWRQVALLSASSAVGDGRQAAVGLAAVLLGLDHPHAALAALDRADPADPWARWWGVLADGQAAGEAALTDDRLRAAGEGLTGPDGRDVQRRLADLALELAALRGDERGEGARFGVLGHRARPDRRMLLGGRSSAVYLVDPGWDGVRLVRLGPPDGTSVGNRAHLAPAEMIGAVRRGESGPGWTVPDDEPPALNPNDMLAALREDTGVRDRRLMELAREVAEEREALREERVQLAELRETLDFELGAARRAKARPPSPSGHPAGSVVPLPRTAREALRLLGLGSGAPPREVERAWRDQVVRCHPDRVVDMHPSIRGQAEGLTVALNAARDLLLSPATPRARR